MVGSQGTGTHHQQTATGLTSSWPAPMQAYLMDNENLGLLGFMSVPGLGGIVHMPYHGGIKQMMALNKCCPRAKVLWHQTNGASNKVSATQKGGQIEADAHVPG